MSKPISNVVDLEAPKPSQPIERAVENLPSVDGGISALASAGAPFTYFDQIDFCFTNFGVAGVTLGAARQIAHGPGNSVRSDKVIVAHLRAPLHAMLALRDTINAVEKMASDQAAAAMAAVQEDTPAGRPH